MRLTLLACLGALVMSCGAVAQTARKDAGNSAQLIQQMQQLAAERTQLQADNAKLKRELDEIRKERDSLKGERESNEKKLRGAEGAAARASGNSKQLEDELARQNTATAELVTKFRETLATMREVETDRTTTHQQLEARNVELKACVDRNAQLYTMNDEILDHLDGQGFWTGLGKAEPFTRIKRNQLENLADDYRARADEAHIAPPADGASPAASTPAQSKNPGS